MSTETEIDLLPAVAKIDASHFRDDIPWRLKNENHSKHSIVLFYANWCGWCTKLKPEFNKVAERCKEQNVECDVLAVDIDKSQSLITRLKEDSECPAEIKSWPTMILYLPNGRMYGKYIGNREVDDIFDTLQAFVMRVFYHPQIEKFSGIA